MTLSQQFRTDEIYHVFNKSISNYGIFKDKRNASRFIDALFYYNKRFTGLSLSKYLVKNKNYHCDNLLFPQNRTYVKFITYCVMPDHYHLLIKVKLDHYFSKYIGDVENSFTRYFNVKFERKGPLWQTGFKAVKIESNEQLLHVSRYIHLNPTTSNLVENPQDWPFSSYRNFINNKVTLKDVTTEISIQSPLAYKKFVENNKDYQKKLKIIKRLMID